MEKSKSLIHSTWRGAHPWVPVLPAFLIPPLAFLFLRSPGFVWWLAAAFAFFLFDSLGIQIGIHKLMCHRAFKTSAAVLRSLAILSVFSGQGSPIFWVAVHMGSHHPYSDTENDAHAPSKGLFYAFVGWYWKIDAKKLSFLPARRFLTDRTLLFCHKHHNLILLSYWMILILLGFLFGKDASERLRPFVYLGCLPVALSITLVGLVNSQLHSQGSLSRWIFLKYKNHSQEPSFNSILLGFLTMGLGFHNNHHATPSAPYNDQRWFEFDPSRIVIPLLRSDTAETQV